MAWLEDNAPSVAKMEKKITIEQLFKLRGLLPNSTGGRYQISKQQITEYILAIENNREYKWLEKVMNLEQLNENRIEQALMRLASSDEDHAAWAGQND